MATKVNTYDVGSAVTISNTPGFKDKTGTLIDPTNVMCRYGKPDGTVVTLTYGTDAALVRDSLGLYHVDVDTAALPGTWTYRFWAPGPPSSGEAAADNSFIITDSPLK